MKNIYIRDICTKYTYVKNVSSIIYIYIKSVGFNNTDIKNANTKSVYIGNVDTGVIGNINAIKGLTINL